MNKKVNLIMNITTLVVTSLLLIFIVFAWYVTNSQVSVTGVTATTSDETYIHYKNEVVAVRHSLSGDVGTYIYERKASGELECTEYIIKDKDGNTTKHIQVIPANEKKFFMNDMLPGEYVDITLSYYMDDSYDGKNYALRIDNFVADNFVIDGKTHYTTGAFKYKNISLKNKAGSDIADFSSSTFSFFNNYVLSENDTSPESLRVQILSNTWNKTDVEVSYTFRVQEDFTQFYALVNSATGFYGNLLSELNFNIGNLFLYAN